MEHGLSSSPSDLTGVLSRLLLTLGDVDTFLQRLTELAAGIMTPPVACGITVPRDGEPATVASSDQRASALDETQYHFAEGPCLHTLHTGQTVSIPDLTAEVRWPRYLAEAVEQGLRCSLSLPLTANGSTVGAMNVYCFDGMNAFQGEARQPV